MSGTPLNCEKLIFDGMIGTGGIGFGQFFAVDGNDTLGREESRSGTFLDRRDYCKLHIVSTYMKNLLGLYFQVFPIGYVGDDEPGQMLIQEMEATGLRVKRVEVLPGETTLFSFCVVYPDRSVCNMTTSDSACSRVTADVVAATEVDFANLGVSGVTMALPEVPLEARVKALELGTKYDMLRVASFTEQEMPDALAMGLATNIDLLALNIGEAAAAVGGKVGNRSSQQIVEAAYWKFARLNSELALSVTGGPEGSWICAEGQVVPLGPVPVDVVSTSGAGDAFLAGLVSGLCCGISITGAQQLGTLCAGLSVTCEHSIHPELDRRTLHELSAKCDWGWDPALLKMLADPVDPGSNETQELRSLSQKGVPLDRSQMPL